MNNDEFHAEFCGKCKLLACEPVKRRRACSEETVLGEFPEEQTPGNSLKEEAMQDSGDSTLRGRGSLKAGVWAQLNPGFPHILAGILALKICSYRNHW